MITKAFFKKSELVECLYFLEAKMRKAEIKAFATDEIKQAESLQDSASYLDSLENLKFKDSDTLLGFNLSFCGDISKLFFLQIKKLAEVNGIQSDLKPDYIDELFSNNRLDKFESILTYLNQMEALSREYQRTGVWYEEQSKRIKSDILNQLQEYKQNNPNWENQKIVYSKDELERFYAVEEKFIDKPRSDWHVYQQDGNTVHEELID